MTLVKISELLGSSEKSFEDALQQIVNQFSTSGKKVTGIKIISQSAEVKDGKVIAYKVNAKVAYLWDENK